MSMKFEAERLWDLPALPTGWEVAATGVGADSTFLTLMADTPFEARRAGQSSRYRVLKRAGDSLEAFEFVSAGPAAYSVIQPIDDRNFLLVTTRAYEGMEKNAHVWGRDGSPVRQFSLGDGIEDAQTSTRSDIWVSYFDEGIFTAGEPGLACFDPTGKRVFSFADSVANDDDVPRIDDCYGLNVATADEVWVYYYTAFPLVKLVNMRLERLWPHIPGLGAHAFAVGEGSVLFAGDYGARTSITRCFLESGRIETGHAIGDGKPLEFTRAIGRGERLYLVANSAVWLLQAD